MPALLLDTIWTEDLVSTCTEEVMVETDPWAAQAAARKASPASRARIDNLDQWLDLCA